MAKILVVEDTIALHTVMRLSLEIVGYDVSLVESVRAAIQAVQQESYDLILLDYNLPDGCGDELLHYLNNQHENQEDIVPVIVISGSIQKYAIQQLLDLGVKDYLIKPVAVDELLIHVKQWLPKDVAH